MAEHIRHDGLTIDQMVDAAVPDTTIIFDRPREPISEERFFRVGSNSHYRPERLDWLNAPGIFDAPFMQSRWRPRIGLEDLEPPQVVFEGPARDIVDFYAPEAHVFFLSEQLYNIVSSSDAGAVEVMQVEVTATDERRTMYIVAPIRMMSVVDTMTTSVAIKSRTLPGGKKIENVYLPDGVAFRDDIAPEVMAFHDIDVVGWLWSRDLLAKAEAAGCLGLRATSISERIERDFRINQYPDSDRIFREPVE